jgi:hypothetical protein
MTNDRGKPKVLEGRPEKLSPFQLQMIHVSELGQQAEKMAKICRTCVKTFTLT